jgi:hypothetical protein
VHKQFRHIAEPDRQFHAVLNLHFWLARAYWMLL